jgi:hypothetical protein
MEDEFKRPPDAGKNASERFPEVPTVCNYCGSKVVLRDANFLFGQRASPGKLYVCSKHGNGCDAYVGCHEGTERSLGSLANRELRYWRKITHYAVDMAWKKASDPKKARQRIYIWMSQVLGRGIETTHIGMFDKKDCMEIIKAAHIL